LGFGSIGVLKGVTLRMVDVNRFVPKEAIASIHHLAAVLRHSSYSVKNGSSPLSKAA